MKIIKTLSDIDDLQFGDHYTLDPSVEPRPDDKPKDFEKKKRAMDKIQEKLKTIKYMEPQEPKKKSLISKLLSK